MKKYLHHPGSYWLPGNLGRINILCSLSDKYRLQTDDNRVVLKKLSDDFPELIISEDTIV
ncbi:hypothetical protein [Methanospirillum sp.]|uniref:hypothetical protein n=1 Tax=Methanospirillum sp. TaxID=45200 RepID=UPI0035A18EBA